MDPRLKDALEHADYVTTFNNQKRLLQQKYKKDCILYYKGHAFVSSVELLAFALNQGEAYWLIDANNVPVYIDDVLDFYTQLKNKYNSATSSYGEAYNEMLSSKRNVEGLFGV